MYQNKSYFQIERHLSLVLYSQKHLISKWRVKVFPYNLWKNYNSIPVFQQRSVIWVLLWKSVKKIYVRFTGELQKILILLIKVPVSSGKKRKWKRTLVCILAHLMCDTSFFFWLFIKGWICKIHYSATVFSVLCELVRFDKDFFLARTAGEGRICESEKSEQNQRIILMNE